MASSASIPAEGEYREPAETPGATRAERRRARKQKEKPEGLWPKIKEILVVVVLALLIAFLVKTFLVRGFYIPSGSMENSLQLKDRIFVNVAGNWVSDPDRGDVVVFEDTEGWIPEGQTQDNPVRDALSFVGVMPDSSQNYLIKRVIGKGGDTVECDAADQEVKVNGKTLNESSYLYPNSLPCGMQFKVTVPDGKYFVMGDHRDASADSRYHISTGTEFVSRDDITGKAAVIAWPFNRAGGIDSHQDVFQDVPAASSSK